MHVNYEELPHPFAIMCLLNHEIWVNAPLACCHQLSYQRCNRYPSFIIVGFLYSEQPQNYQSLRTQIMKITLNVWIMQYIFLSCIFVLKRGLYTSRQKLF